jgi:hypothetical protein
VAETTSLVAALAAAQAEFPSITRNREGQLGNRRYKYADLAEVLAAVNPALTKHGIAHVHRFEQTPEGRTLLVTELLFGEERLSSALPLPLAGQSLQDIGRAITYLRRYALGALLDICPEDDDDAQDSGHVRQPESPPRSSPPRQIAPPRQPVREDRRYAA